MKTVRFRNCDNCVRSISFWAVNKLGMELPAMAFGGTRPTLLDALNVCDRERPGNLSGDARPL